jgi:hypothetical protein
MKTSHGISLIWTLALALAPFAPQEQQTASVPIAPKQMQAEFSRRVPKRIWTDNIVSATNKKLYIFSLEPQVDVDKHIIGVDLVLRDAEKSKTDENLNLLNPPGNWHGLQPYNFMASDLLHGAEQSAFGKNRNIRVASRRLAISIQIMGVRVSTLPNGTHEIDELRLSLSADNLPPSS